MEGLEANSLLAKDIRQKPSNVSSIVDAAMMRTGELEAREPNRLTEARLLGKLLPLHHKTLHVEVGGADRVWHFVKIAILPELLKIVVTPRAENEAAVPIEPRLEVGYDVLEYRRSINVSLANRCKACTERGELGMSGWPNEALELIHHLKIGGFNHDGPNLNDLHVLPRYRTLVATSGFEINDEITLWLHLLASNV